MKRSSLFSLIKTALFSVYSSTALGSSSVHLYNWYDFIAPETPTEFKSETGIAVVVDAFDSAEVMQSKLMVGHSGYDVVVVTSDVLPSLIKAGVLQELNRNLLSNWSHLDPVILAKLQVNDPENRYAVPYLWGTTGIGYNVDKIKAALGDNAPLDSWDLVFKEENISKLQQCGVTMLDSPSEIFPIALHYLGLPHNSKKPDDYKKAQELLLKIRPYIRYFNSSKSREDLANGNTCLSVDWAGSVIYAQEANESTRSGRKIAYSIPHEGGLMWSENLVLLKKAPHPTQGITLINYLLRPEVIAKTSNYLGYPNANKAATALVTQRIRDNPGAYPDKEVIATLFALEPLPLKLQRLRTRLWTKLKSGI
ncbi:polyamine ABC transporter substrate-binding protein [Pseudomonas sp. Fl4BN1]|uniref:polyamine ABC transporter substrate-binding protein n=1 Tax=Pseudomonas sp. Fl4BN1 TaxID=2697651 RepID=UPI0013765E13|nr:polyamine ABC transporter substrate-binding protein [Pseudomonas sp. Fl4BN1]NBF09993.1 extracellular solute-binding protein [Pseudomonas sp. Fl4BN1]